MSIWNLLKTKPFWGLVGIIFLGKMAYLMVFGVMFEEDSYGYLTLHAGLYHPPAYGVFTWLSTSIVPSIYTPAVLQSFIFSLSTALFLSFQFRMKKWKWGAAILLAIEPTTGLFCASILTEAIFISLLLLIFTFYLGVRKAKGKQLLRYAIVLGLLLGLTYLVRYTAPLILVVIALHWFWERRKIVEGTLLLLGMIVGMQLMILPLRIYYKINFDTWSVNAFTSLSIWNSAAYLYPASSAAVEPETAFEAHLQSFPDSVYNMEATWTTSHIFQPGLPFHEYIRIEGFSAKLFIATAKSAGNTGLGLFLRSPSRHFLAFVLPNFSRPFRHDERIESRNLDELTMERFAYQKTSDPYYYTMIWWVLFGTLLLTTLVSFWRKADARALFRLLLLFSWAYIFSISLLGVVFLRMVYMLGPLVLIALLLLLAGQRRSEE